MKPSMSYEGIRKYYLGEWNTCAGKDCDDGSQQIILSSVKSDKIYRFRVKDLYGENEQVLEYQEIIAKTPEYIKQRMAEAKQIQKGGEECL
ncbi:unnamed protein product [marine sediment metagenome]|uniref:Uncharacterized protein n=1 Tax=marine sediment metagenome TaxID=412755 RepID=X1PGX8_9ZZZZ